MANWYEPGLYHFRIKTQGITETKESKKPMLVFTGEPIEIICRDAEGNDVSEPVSPDPTQNYDRTLRIVIDASNDNSIDFAHKKLRYAGFIGKSFNDLDLVGTVIRAKCEEGEYNNKPTEEWDFALPPLDVPQARSLESGDIRTLDTLFGQKLRDGTNRPTTKPTAQPATEPAPQPEREPVGASTDEVPF